MDASGLLRSRGDANPDKRRRTARTGGGKSLIRERKCPMYARVRQVNLDPVTLEVIRNALPAISTEMAADLQRTSYNMMIYEVRDFCTAVLSADGELVSQN